MASNIPLSSASVKRTLEQYGLKPQKSLGQNFLVDSHVLQKILQTANIQPTDTIIEVGPGLGILTQALAKEAKQVIAIEKDCKIVEILKETTKDLRNTDIVCADILKLGPTELFTTYKVVANLPYYITSPVIRKFLEAEQKPELMVFMVQKEVAQRICARPPKMNLLAVSVQFYGEPKIASYVKKNSFWPRPNVDSAILRIDIRFERALMASRRATAFFKIVRAGFKQPRKQLLNNFTNELKLDRELIEHWLKQNNVSPTQRAETLSLEDWETLAENFQKL